MFPFFGPRGALRVTVSVRVQSGTNVKIRESREKLGNRTQEVNSL